MTVYLITGARRGIGFEYVRQLAASPSNTIIAAVRDLQGDNSRLESLRNDPITKSPIHLVQCDQAEPESIAKLAAQLPDNLPIDILIQNSAIIDVAALSDTSLDVKAETMLELFRVNTVGPTLLTQVLVPHLAKGGIIANITSGLGSLGCLSDRIFPIGNPSYSVSKAALNMMTVHQAKDLEGKAIVVSIDVGHVKTDMGGPNAALEADFTASSVLKVLGGLKAEDSGKFFQYDGKIQPW